MAATTMAAVVNKPGKWHNSAPLEAPLLVALGAEFEPELELTGFVVLETLVATSSVVYTKFTSENTKALSLLGMLMFLLGEGPLTLSLIWC